MNKTFYNLKTFAVVALAALCFAPTYSAESMHANGVLLVVARSAHKVVRVNSKTWKIEAHYAVGKGPHEISAGPAGKYAAVANFGLFPKPHENPITQGQLQWKTVPENSVTVIDLEGYTPPKTWGYPDCGATHGIAVDDIRGVLWNTCDDLGVIQEINIETGEVIRKWSTKQKTTHILKLSNDRSTLVASNVDSGTISVIDLERGDVDIIESGRGSEGLALTADGSVAWVANTHSNTISKIDLKKRVKLSEFRSFGKFPVKIALTPDEKELWIVHNSSSEITIIDTTTLRKTESIKLDSPPLGLFIPNHGNYAFVTTPRRNEVRVFNLQSRKTEHVISGIMEGDGMEWVK